MPLLYIFSSPFLCIFILPLTVNGKTVNTVLLVRNVDYRCGKVLACFLRCATCVLFSQYCYFHFFHLVFLNFSSQVTISVIVKQYGGEIKRKNLFTKQIQYGTIPEHDHLLGFGVHRPSLSRSVLLNLKRW